MRKQLLVAACLLALAVPALAQPVPSAVTTILPCRAFDSRVSGGPFEAGSTHYFRLRPLGQAPGVCNIPATANAVLLTAVTINSATFGHVKIWQGDVPAPAASSFNFRQSPGASSSYVPTLLSYPDEGNVDISVFVSQETDVVLDVVGWTEPLPE